MIRNRMLLASSLLFVAPLASGFTEFKGTCETGANYVFQSGDGGVKVKAICTGSWSLDGYVDASDAYVDGEVNTKSIGGFKCKGSYYGPWKKFTKYKTVCDGGGSRDKINIEIKTK